MKPASSKVIAEDAVDPTSSLPPLNWLIINIKGGVGKSSFAHALQLIEGSQIVTNDLCGRPVSKRVIRLDPNQQSLNKVDLSAYSSVVFDLGASYGQFDPRIAQAVKQADVILIPTGINTSEIQAAIATYRWLAQEEISMVLIYNRVTADDHKKRLDAAIQQVQDAVGEHSYFVMGQTTLFRRLETDGATWSERVFNQHGLGRLRQPWKDLKEMFAKVAWAVRQGAI